MKLGRDGRTTGQPISEQPLQRRSHTPSGKLSAREQWFPSRPGQPDDYQCYNYDYASRLASVWTAAAKNCTTAPTPGTNGPVGPGQTINLKVTGNGGIPASGVSAVAMNITVTSPTSVGNITAYAGGTPEPDTSNVNYVQGQTVPNSAIVPVGADGTVSFTNNSSGTVQLIADTSGYYLAPATGQPGPHRLQSMTSTPAAGTPTTNTFTWDAAGRMTGRAGETLSYAPDGKLATTTGTATLPVNPNPSATAGTPPAHRRPP